MKFNKTPLALGLAALFANSRRLRRRLDPAEYAAPRPRDLPQRHPMLIAWLVPGALFDDDDWPGATPGMTPAARRAALRQRAGTWLAREGIGLANTRARLRELYGDRHEFTLANHPDGGLEVRVSIPL